MKNSTDFIQSLIVQNFDETIEITEENFKEVISELESSIKISEDDNDEIDKRYEKLDEDWYITEPKTKKGWEEYNEKSSELDKQVKENKEYIKKCENTIKLIETFAELRGWA